MTLDGEAEFVLVDLINRRRELIKEAYDSDERSSNKKFIRDIVDIQSAIVAMRQALVEEQFISDVVHGGKGSDKDAVDMLVRFRTI